MAAFEVGGRGLLEFPHRRARELEERFVVPLQGVGGQRGERFAQAGLGRLEQRELLGG